MMDRPKTIENLVIKYNGETFDKIVDFYISNYDDADYNVRFTNADSEQEVTNIRCKLTDIKIIIKK